MKLTREQLHKMILREMADMSASSNIYGSLDDRLAQYQNKSNVDFVIETFDELGLLPLTHPGHLKDYMYGYGEDEDGDVDMPLGLLNTMSGSETAEGIYRGIAKAILYYLKNGHLGFAADPFLGPVINPQTYERAPMPDNQKLTILMHHLAKFIGDKNTFRDLGDQ